MPRPRKKQRRFGVRTKTFSGCMTCRSRHVKCDEQRPSCQRCLNSRIQCSGYPGYRARLLWRSLTLSDFEASPCLPETNDVQPDPGVAGREHLDSASIDAQPPSSERSYRSRSFSRTSGSPSLGISSQQVDTSVVSRGRQSDSPSRLPSPSLSPGPPLGPATGSHDVSRPIESGCADSPSQSVASCRAQGPSSSSVSSPVYASHGCVDRRTVHTPRHIDLLSSLHHQRQLIEHWVDHLSDALMPIPGPSNPLKSIFVPIANAGALCPATESSGSVALFYLICSAAAFHISANSEDMRRQSDFMTLALSHHNQGIHHLQHNLSRDDPCQRESVLASLLMCLTYEPVTVGPNFWQNHLRGAARWLQKSSVEDLTQTETATILYQTLTGTAMFLRSQILLPELSHNESLCFDLRAMPGTYYLYHIFGLCRETLELISGEITTAVRLRNGQGREPSQSAGDSASDFDRMEMQLYLAMPRDLRGISETHTGGDLAREYSWIFYYASIIYFKRTVRNSPPEEVQSLVEQSLTHIESLRHCTSRPFSPFVWPVAIAFLEAQHDALQKRALLWLDFIITRSTLSAWRRAKPLICSFWAERKIPGKGDMQWETFLSDPSNPSIMMV